MDQGGGSKQSLVSSICAIGSILVRTQLYLVTAVLLSYFGRHSLANAVIFGLVHFSWGPVGIVQTTCMGLAFVVSYLLVRRNLWVLVLAHAYMDTILLVQIYLTPTTE